MPTRSARVAGGMGVARSKTRPKTTRNQPPKPTLGTSVPARAASFFAWSGGSQSLCSRAAEKLKYTRLRLPKLHYSYVAKTCQLKPLWAWVAAPDQGPRAARLWRVAATDQGPLAS